MNFNSLAKQTIYKGHRAWCCEQKQALIQLLIDGKLSSFEHYWNKKRRVAA